MSELAFVNEKTGKRYKVVKFDREAGKVTLIGEHGVEFTEKFDKELFKRLGYNLVTA
jgi:hypothetical protein